MKNRHKVTGKKFQVIKIQALVLCCLLVFFSCTKENKKTDHDYPRVATELVTDINANGATFNGLFLSAGKCEIIDHGFVFDMYDLPNTQRSEKISLGASNGSGSFTSMANFGMELGKTYYVSAYAQNKENIFYAQPVNFISMGSISPEIHAIVPSEGVRGDTVLIKGKYFSQQPLNNSVKFGDVVTSVIKTSDTALTVFVPSSNGWELADVFVTTAGKIAQKINGFRYLKPVITNLSPIQSVIGDTIAITGKYFRPDMEIKFNQVKARIYRAGYTSARAIIPACQSASANILVTADGLTTAYEQKFTYAQPEITGLSTNQGVIDDTITIYGKNFGYLKNVVFVFFGEQPATVLYVNNSSIEVIVPASGGKTSLAVTVRVDGQIAEGYQMFSYTNQ